MMSDSASAENFGRPVTDDSPMEQNERIRPWTSTFSSSSPNNMNEDLNDFPKADESSLIHGLEHSSLSSPMMHQSSSMRPPSFDFSQMMSTLGHNDTTSQFQSVMDCMPMLQSEPPNNSVNNNPINQLTDNMDPLLRSTSEKTYVTFANRIRLTQKQSVKSFAKKASPGIGSPNKTRPIWLPSTGRSNGLKSCPSNVDARPSTSFARGGDVPRQSLDTIMKQHATRYGRPHSVLCTTDGLTLSLSHYAMPPIPSTLLPNVTFRSRSLNRKQVIV
jgi:hypothetical protein